MAPVKPVKTCCIEGCNAVLPHPHQFYCDDHRKQRKADIQREYRLKHLASTKGKRGRPKGTKEMLGDKKPAVKNKPHDPYGWLKNINQHLAENGGVYNR